MTPVNTVWVIYPPNSQMPDSILVGHLWASLSSLLWEQKTLSWSQYPQIKSSKICLWISMKNRSGGEGRRSLRAYRESRHVAAWLPLADLMWSRDGWKKFECSQNYANGCKLELILSKTFGSLPERKARSGLTHLYRGWRMLHGGTQE